MTLGWLALAILLLTADCRQKRTHKRKVTKPVVSHELSETASEESVLGNLERFEQVRKDVVRQVPLNVVPLQGSPPGLPRTQPPPVLRMPPPPPPRAYFAQQDRPSIIPEGYVSPFVILGQQRAESWIPWHKLYSKEELEKKIAETPTAPGKQPALTRSKSAPF